MRTCSRGKKPEEESDPPKRPQEHLPAVSFKRQCIEAGSTLEELCNELYGDAPANGQEYVDDYDLALLDDFHPMTESHPMTEFRNHTRFV